MATLRVTNLRGRSSNVAPDFPDGANMTGVCTATTFVGALTGAATGLSGTPDITVDEITANYITGIGATFTGTVTYENVQNIDSAGIVTARGGVKVGPLTGIGVTINVGGDISAAGIVTATDLKIGGKSAATTGKAIAMALIFG